MRHVKRLRAPQHSLVKRSQPDVTFFVHLDATDFIGTCLRILVIKQLTQVGKQHSSSFGANPEQSFLVVITRNHTCLEILFSVMKEGLKIAQLDFPFRRKAQQSISVPGHGQVPGISYREQTKDIIMRQLLPHSF